MVILSSFPRSYRYDTDTVRCLTKTKNANEEKQDIVKVSFVGSLGWYTMCCQVLHIDN